MTSQIDQLRSSFSKMNTAQKKVFIDNLTQKLKGVNNAEYTRFLDECVTTYSAEAIQGQSQQAAPVSQVSSGGAAFCTKCGERLDAGARFCAECGVPTTSAAAAYTAAPNFASALLNMPRNAVIIVICAVVLAAVVLLLLNEPMGRSGLTGTWVPNNPGYARSNIEFSGNRFTATSSVSRSWYWVSYISLFPDIVFVFYNDLDDLEHIGGNRYRFTATGTFSISESGDRIEFVFSNGDIVVLPFSRTENTIEIAHQRFTRR